MKPATPAQAHAQLVREIDAHNYRYYALDDPIVTIRSVPLRIEHAGKLTLRGEVVIYRRDLDTLNVEREAQGLDPFSNPRNAAAGAVRMLDPREVARRPLRALFYQVVEGPRLH